MEALEKCIICSAENIREYYDDGPIGRVEENYYCNNCGYFYTMSYGPPIESVDILSGTKKDRERKQRLLKENRELIESLNIIVNPY